MKYNVKLKMASLYARVLVVTCIAFFMASTAHATSDNRQESGETISSLPQPLQSDTGYSLESSEKMNASDAGRRSSAKKLKMVSRYAELPLTGARRLALDAVNLYWVDTGALRFVPRTGGSITTLAGGLAFPTVFVA